MLNYLVYKTVTSEGNNTLWCLALQRVDKFLSKIEHISTLNYLHLFSECSKMFTC